MPTGNTMNCDGRYIVFLYLCSFRDASVLIGMDASAIRAAIALDGSLLTLPTSQSLT